MTSSSQSQPHDSSDILRSGPRPSLSSVLLELEGRVQKGSTLYRRQRQQRAEAPLPTSLHAMDALLGGGLARGALIEIVGRSSCGRFATIMAALQAVTAAGEAAALVDQGEHLDPQLAVAAGIDLERLLWLRPQRLPDSLAAAEMLVRTGFPLVALDLGLPPVRGRATLAAWLRLARCCAEHQAVALAGVPYRLSGCAADAVVKASRNRGLWSRTAAAPPLLLGLSAEIELARRRGQRSQQRTLLNLRVADALFGPHTPPDMTQALPTTSEVSHVKAL